MYTSGKPLGKGELARRILRLEEAIGEFGGEWFAFTSLVQKTGLPKGTVHRQLALFVEEGRLERGYTPRIARAYREVRQEGMTTILEKIEWLRTWLRAHDHGDEQDTSLETYLGLHFEPRLDDMIAFLKTLDHQKKRKEHVQ